MLERAAERSRCLLAAAVAVAWVATCAAQASSAPAGVEALKAEVSADRALFAPGSSLRIRFLLINPTDEVIEVPDVRVPANAVGLPPSVVYGDAAKPSLTVALESGRPDTLRPEKTTEGDVGDVPLRLSARAVIGTEMDLREHHRELRYSGLHRLEWKPLGGKLGTVSFEFRVEPRKYAVMVTDFGKLTFTLMYDKAPRNVENFLDLARDRFYDGSLIHRVIPEFLIQGGKPVGGQSDVRPDGRTVGPEFHDAPFDAGTLAMALRGNNPHSASCQFFVTLSRQPELDGTYTVIGQTSDDESLRTLRAIATQRTDDKGQPLRPIRIQNFTLFDVEGPKPERLELGGRGP